VHTAHGVRCVFRVGSCVDMALPTELAAATDGAPPPPVVELDYRAQPSNATAAAWSAAADALLRTHRGAPVVLLALRLPASSDAEITPVERLREQLPRTHPRLRTAMRMFGERCGELVDRSKRRRRECTNVC
jgi:hypothetical protein